MEDMTKLVAEKTGLNEAMARVAVETIVAALKQRLPEGARGFVDAAVRGGDGGAPGPVALGGVLGALGGVLK